MSALEESKEIEANAEKEVVWRIDNKALPALKEKASKKWDKKQESKEDESSTGELTERHFKNPKILAFKVEDTEKPNWRDMENDLLLKYPGVWVLYSRSDEEKTGHLLILGKLWLVFLLSYN